MKDISALTGGAAAKRAVGAGKAGGASTGGGPLDGAFAALFGLIAGGKDKLLRTGADTVSTQTPTQTVSTGDKVAAKGAVKVEAAELAVGAKGKADGTIDTKAAVPEGTDMAPGPQRLPETGLATADAEGAAQNVPAGSQAAADVKAVDQSDASVTPKVATAKVAKPTKPNCDQKQDVVSSDAVESDPKDGAALPAAKRKGRDDDEEARRSDKAARQPDLATTSPPSIAAAAAQAAQAAQPAQSTQKSKDNASNGAASSLAAVSLESSGPKPAATPQGTVAAQAQQGEATQAATAAAGDATSAPGPATPAAHAGRSQDKHLAASGAAQDGSLKSADSGASLSDIVQSLPPGIQSQLTPGGAPGIAGLGATPGSVPSTGDQLSGQVIDMGVSGQWIDRMAREIATLASGSGHSRFQLSPPNLGRIQVDLWQGDTGTNVRLLTETDDAARRLRDGQSALEAHAQVAALSLGSVTVEKSSAHFDSGRDQNGNQNQRQMADSGGQAQQQAGGQAQNQSGMARNMLNQAAFPAVIGPEQRVEPAPAATAGPVDGRRVRYA